MNDPSETVGELGSVEGSEDWFDLRLNEGTDDAWEEILRVDGPTIWRIVRALVSTGQVDAEDLAQDLAQIVRHNLWKQRRAIHAPARAYFNYRRMTCRNVWITWLRQRRAHPELFLEDLLDPEADETPMDRLLPPVLPPQDPDPLLLLLEGCLVGLERQAQELVRLHYFAGMRLEEVAAALDISYRTAKRLHKEIKQQLAVSLKQRMVSHGRKIR